jgi:FlaA1/EpsC-like NDP-sugar epimerase
MIPVLIYTADDAGIMLLQWLQQTNNTQMTPVGFLDDDPYKKGREILGISVFGKPEEIESIFKTHEIKGILFTSNQIVIGERLEAFLSKCADLGVWVKTMRIEFDSLE